MPLLQQGWCAQSSMLLWLILTVVSLVVAPAAGQAMNMATPKVTISGTLGLTGELANVSRMQKYAMDLFVRESNNRQVWKRNGMYTVEVELDIVDDQSNRDISRQYYENMTMRPSGSPHYYIGPSSASFSREAALVANKTGNIIMLHDASSSTFYREHFPSVFSVSVLDLAFFNRAIYMLWDQGAKSIMSSSATSLPYTTVCHGTLEAARYLGLKIVGNFSSTLQGLHSTKFHSADVFVICGDLDYIARSIAIAHALLPDPPAMLVSSPDLIQLLNKTKPTLALYSLGGTTWHTDLPHINHAKIWSSAADFQDSFKRMYGFDPDHHAAQAAAACIALMEGVMMSTCGIACKDNVQQKLRNTKIPTFYGELNFSDPQGAAGLSAYLQQLQRRSDASRAEPVEKAVTSVLVSNAEQLRYPNPSRANRSLELYQCRPGEMYTGGNCTPCAQGTFRDGSLAECKACHEGSYNTQHGMSTCFQCTSGLDCNVAKLSGTVAAAAGWYQVGNEQHYACSPKELCLGANKCVDGSEGLFCGGCRHGYRKELASAPSICRTCKSDWHTILWACQFFASHLILVWVMAAGVTSSARALDSLHSVIARIFLNYVTFTAVALKASGLLTHPSTEALANVIRWTIEPLGTWIHIECLFLGDQLESYQVLILFGCFLMPIALFLNFLCVLVFDLLLNMFGCLGDDGKQDSSSVPVAVAVEATHQEEAQDGKIKDDDSNKSSEHASTASEESGVQSAPVCESTSVAAIMVNTTPRNNRATICRYDRQSVNQDVWKSSAEHISSHTIQTSTIWMFLLYPLTLQQLALGFSCVQLDVFRLQADLNVECSLSHTWVRFSVVVFLLYAIFIPLFICYLIQSKGGQHFHVSYRERYGFLFMGYKPREHHMEVITAIRKAAVIMLGTVPSEEARMISLLSVGLASIALQVATRPFDARDFFILHRLEIISILSFIATCGMRLSFLVVEQISLSSLKATLTHSAVSGCGIVLCACTHLYFLVLVAQSLVRNIFTKHLLFIEEFFPDRLSATQRFFLRTTEYRHHPVSMNPHTHELDISMLSHKERRFLFRALCHTMRHYFHAVRARGKKELGQTPGLNLGCMVGALQFAFQVVHESRKMRGQQCLQLENQGLSRRGVLSSLWGSACRMRKQNSSRIPSSVDSFLRNMKSLLSFAQPGDDFEEQALQEALDKRAWIASVEELHLALMLSWQDIEHGVPEFFQAEKLEEEVHEEVTDTGMVTWSETDTVLDLLKRLEQHGTISKEPEAGPPDSIELDENTIPTVSDRFAKHMGLQHVEPNGSLHLNLLEREHDELLSEVLELRTSIKALERCTAIEATEQAQTKPADCTGVNGTITQSPSHVDEGSLSMNIEGTASKITERIRLDAEASAHLPPELETKTSLQRESCQSFQGYSGSQHSTEPAKRSFLPLRIEEDPKEHTRDEITAVRPSTSAPLEVQQPVECMLPSDSTKDQNHDSRTALPSITGVTLPMYPIPSSQAEAPLGQTSQSEFPATAS